MIKSLVRVRVFCFSVSALAIFGSGGKAQAQQCYYDKSVGCDPEGYGYAEVACPSNCREGDLAHVYGCTDDNGTVEHYSLKNMFFDNLIMRWPGQDMSLNAAVSYLQDVNKDWLFNVCLRQGTCNCELVWHPTGLTGRVCRLHEEFVWEEGFPQLTQTACDFQLADDPCDCQGDPQCEYYCYYGGE